MDAMALLDRASGVQADVLQIADTLPLHLLPAAGLRELAREAAHRGIALEAGTKGTDSSHLLRYLDIAVALGAKLVRTLPHDGNDRPDFAEALKRLNAIKREYEEAGVVLAIENYEYYPSPWLAQLIEAADSPSIGICLDAVNNLGCGESFAEVIGSLGRHTVNFHCKDYRITRSPTMMGFDVSGCPAGEGMLDLRLAGQVLRDDISWIIESWVPWQGDSVSTLAMEKDWLVRGMENLRRYSKSRA
jgi:sugar phosphate isomerase/epimerase